MKFVLDASVTLRWFFGDGAPRDLRYANAVLDAMRESNALVPSIWGLEVVNVIARAEAQGFVTVARSDAFLELLATTDIRTDGATSSQAFSAILQVSRRYSLSSYDASYLELALREGLPIATLDDGLQKAARRAGVKRFAA